MLKDSLQWLKIVREIKSEVHILMKKVLVIAYQFPPMGGSGIQRTVKFVKYLRSFGWEPVVFTRELAGMGLKDESMLADIPSGIRVARIASWDFTELSGILKYPGKFFGRKILIPDSERLWQYFGRKKAVSVVKEEGIDLIYTTSYPYSDHLMGLHLKRVLPGIPWVADFRDEWTNNPYLLDNPHNRLRMRLEKGLEKNVLTHADYLIANTPKMLDNFLQNSKDIKGLKDKFCFIPNGYDEEDFAGLPSDMPENHRFTMTYAGLLYGQRKPDTLFEAVRRLIAKRLADAGRIRIKLIGNYKEGYMNKLAESYGLKDVVEVYPYMEHGECLRQLVSSDALLHIEGNGRGSEAFYSGKIFEYMNTGKPVLAIIPAKGAAAQLIRDTRIGLVADSDDVEQAMENIRQLYSGWENKTVNFAPDREKIAGYERKVLTGKLAEVFNQVLNK